MLIMNRSSKLGRLIFAVVVAGLMTGACGRSPGVAGHWTGPLDLGSLGAQGKSMYAVLHVAFDIREEAGGLRATMSREDEDQPVQADRVAFKDGSLIVAIDRRKHKQVFDLNLSADGKEL